MAGIDLRQVAAPSGSEMVQQDAGAAMAPYTAMRRLGGSIQGVAQAVHQKDQERQKLEAQLDQERQKLYDSNSEAFVDRKARAAKNALSMAMAESKGDTNAWQDVFESSWKQVEEAYSGVAGSLSPEKAAKIRNDMLDQMETQRGVLGLAVVSAERKAKDESWMLTAQLRADEAETEDDWVSVEEAADNVDWANKAQRDEFLLETRRKGQYSAFNRQMLALENPDDLYAFEEEISKTGQENLNKSQRETLALQARQRAVKIQIGYNNTMRDIQRRLKRGEVPGVDEINELIATNDFDPDMMETYEGMVEQAVTRADYKQLYEKDTLSPTFKRKQVEILQKYLEGENLPENIKLTVDRKKEIIREINELGLDSTWAKSELYALMFEASTESLREPDRRWGGLRDDSIGEDERRFRMDYNQRLQTIAREGQLSQDFGTIFFNNEDAISKAFKSGSPADERKLMDNLTRIVVSGMMNEKLKARLSAAPTE